MTGSNPRKKSPAVESLRREQADQARHPVDELEEALEETFPASDPVSAISTTIVGDAADPEDGKAE